MYENSWVFILLSQVICVATAMMGMGESFNA